MKRLGLTILVGCSLFCLGATGGIWAQAFLMPALASSDTFAAVPFVKEWSARTIIIREVQEMFITRDQAAQQVAQRGQSLVVSVQTGSGLILTSDGLVLTLAELVPAQNSVSVVLESADNPLAAQVLKRDTAANLALLKIDRNNLSTVGFESSAALGQDLVMVARVVEGGELIAITNQGTVRTVENDIIRTNMFDKASLKGSALFDLEGNIVGVVNIEQGGRVVAIPASAIRAFTGF